MLRPVGALRGDQPRDGAAENAGWSHRATRAPSRERRKLVRAPPLRSRIEEAMPSGQAGFSTIRTGSRTSSLADFLGVCAQHDDHGPDCGCQRRLRRADDQGPGLLSSAAASASPCAGSTRRQDDAAKRGAGLDSILGACGRHIQVTKGAACSRTRGWGGADP